MGSAIQEVLRRGSLIKIGQAMVAARPEAADEGVNASAATASAREYRSHGMCSSS